VGKRISATTERNELKGCVANGTNVSPSNDGGKVGFERLALSIPVGTKGTPSNDVGKVECKMVIILIAFEEQCTCSCHVGTGIVNETNKKECLEYICKEKELDPFDWSEILVVTDTGHVYQYSI